jgi:poly-gamma-glutamate system protein
MYRPSIKSRRTLFFLMVLAAGLFYWADYSHVKVPQPEYDKKLAAANQMKQALDVLRKNRQEAGWALDEINDPNQSALIGTQYSLITTDQGYLGPKLTSMNPNFAAVIVQMFMEAGLKKGDRAAVAFTGSYPAMNIATIIGCEVYGIEPVIITSVGASNWGANDPDFTYLDMESVLFKAGVIKHKSIAASIGGGDDIGRSLSKVGRALIEDAIKRNQVINIPSVSLDDAKLERKRVYDANAGSGYKIYINVGGGVASLGHRNNGNLIPPGLNLIYVPRNYPARGLIHEYWEKGLPIIHLLNIDKVADQYGLPQAPVPLPQVGHGKIFYEERYNLTIAWISVIVLFGVLLAVLLLDRDKFKLKEEGVDPDTLV